MRTARTAGRRVASPLSWPVEIGFTAYGLRLGLRANRASLEARLRAIVPPGARSCAVKQVDRWYGVVASRRGGTTSFSVNEPEVSDAGLFSAAEAVATTDARLRLFVGEFARDRVFVHAGVVGWKGRAIVVPGRSFSGKSTLIAALLAAGATYLSDEYAVLDEAGRVHPYLRGLSLRRAGSRRGVIQDPGALGARVARRALPVGLVLLTRFEAGAVFAPRPLTAGQAALALLDNALAAQSAPTRVWPALRAAVASARAVQGPRGEATAAARVVLALLG